MPLQSPSRNASLDIPGYGRWDLRCTMLGHGMSILWTVGEAARTRTFYPFVRTSGKWYIEVVFTSIEDRDAFNFWLATYMWRIADPNEPKMLSPVTVSVPPADFTKVGYPTSSLPCGEAFGEVTWVEHLVFMSASDPMLGPDQGSGTLPPLINDYVGRHFYPSYDQDSDAAPPINIAFPEDEPWDTPVIGSSGNTRR